MGKHDKNRPSSPKYDSYYYAGSDDEGPRSEKKYKDKKKYKGDEDSGDERKKKDKDRKRHEKEGGLSPARYGHERREDESGHAGYGFRYERREDESSSSHSERRRHEIEHTRYNESRRDHYLDRPSSRPTSRHSSRPSSRPSSRDDRFRRYPDEYAGYGAHQESHGYVERLNVHTYGHSGYEDQPDYSQTGTYQAGPSPQALPQAPYGSSISYGGYPPASGPPSYPLQQSYGHGYHPQEQPNYDYRPQEQPAPYGGDGRYQPSPPHGPYVNYQPPPAPPPGTPGYIMPTPPPQPYVNQGYHRLSPLQQQSPVPAYSSSVYNGSSSTYNAPSAAYNTPSVAYGAQSTYNSPPAPYDAPSSNNVASSSYSTYSANYGATPTGTAPNPAKPGPAASVLNTFTTGVNSALHDYARTLFPVSTTHKPAAAVGAPGDSNKPHLTTGNRFDSFAPVRGGNRAKWYVDGKDYMYAVSVALENAHTSIWILDWWLSPELYLRRPPAKNEQYRLDTMLRRAADRGVKINIIVYKEVTQALTLNSSHTKHWLENMHENIAVFRHPDHLPDRPTIQQDIFNKFSTGTYSIGDGLKGLYGMSDGVVLYWAHHEKLVLVDGEIAFMGGLDLCFGRWDMNNHPIADAHPSDAGAVVFPGQDYNNARLMDFHTVEQWNQNKVSRTESSRMGWSDVALSFTGPTVSDLRCHFVERWNFIYLTKYKVRNDPRFHLLDTALIDQPPEFISRRDTGFNRGAMSERERQEREDRKYGRRNRPDLDGVQCQIVRSCSKWSHGAEETEHSIAEAYIEIILAAKHFIYIENQFFITATGPDQSPIINRIGQAIVDRITKAFNDRQKFRIIVVMPAVPAFAGDLQDEGSLGTRAIMEFQYRSICNDRDHSIMEKLKARGIDPKEYIRFYNLRNYDRINTSRTMQEVQRAAGVSYNSAADGFSDRIGGGYGQGRYEQEAYYRYQQQAPGGSTEWDSVSSCAMLNGGDIRNVPWHGRPEDEMNAFVSEELYVHSKLLIADDSTVICGSANLNDRSQLGDHDSEIAIIIDDDDLIDSIMDGQYYKASRFAATLRRHIFRKHLGLIPAQTLDGQPDANMLPAPAPNSYDFGSPEDQLVVDPLSENFWSYWNITAHRNTEVFSKAFHTVPNDKVRNWRQYQDWYSRYFVPSKEEKMRAERVNKQQAAAAAAAGLSKPEDIKPRPLVEWGHVVREEFPEGVGKLKDLLSQVKGHLVEMPLDFLIEEDIAKEGLGLNALTETIYT